INGFEFKSPLAFEIGKIWCFSSIKLVRIPHKYSLIHLLTEKYVFLFFSRTDNSNSTLQLDDITLDVDNCDPPISCSFNDQFCGWSEDTSNNSMLWSVGPGRVLSPSKLNLTRLVDVNAPSILYSDFTTITS